MIDTVWVVMENDFPAAVCASETLAETFIDDKVREAKKRQVPPGPYPRVYWRAYPFQVRTQQ